MNTVYLDDLKVGDNWTGAQVPVVEADVIRFAREFDPQPMHIDPEAARAGRFGGIIASGWHTCSLAMRMMCDAYLLEAASLGSPGVDGIKWLKPVRPGDTLRVRFTVIEARPLESRPGVGLIGSHWRMFNQKDECVMEMEGHGMFRRRPAA